MGVGYIATRIDCFLVSDTFLIRDLMLTSFTLPSTVSDHKPIALVLSNPENLGPIPFRFNSSLIQKEKAMGIVKMRGDWLALALLATFGKES